MLKSTLDSFKYFESKIVDENKNVTNYIKMITRIGDVICKIPTACFDAGAYDLWLDPKMPCHIPASQLFEHVNFTIDALSNTVNGSEWLENVQNTTNFENNKTGEANSIEALETGTTGIKILAIGFSIVAVIGRVNTSEWPYIIGLAL